MTISESPQTAIIHDWMLAWGGAEKTLESIYRVFPSPIYTLFCRPESFRENPALKNAEVHPSFLNRFPRAATGYRNYLPLYPLAVRSFDLSRYRMVISSSYAVAKGVRLNDDQLHLCYCYSPMRYAWDLRDQYMEGLGFFKKAAATLVLDRIQKWDLETARRVDLFTAISQNVARRIQKHYGRGCNVIYPPVDTELFQLEARKEPYFVTVSRLVPYKRVDLIVAAFSRLGLPLTVIGDGPEWPRVHSGAKDNVTFIRNASDEQVRAAVSRARAFIFAAEEDFGIAPVEALACGTPVIGYGKGGLLETVQDGVHGVHFNEQSADSLAEAVSRFESLAGTLDPREMRRQAEKFSRQRFEAELKDYFEKAWTVFKKEGRAGVRKLEPNRRSES